jgi:hypothetical protein
MPLAAGVVEGPAALPTLRALEQSIRAKGHVDTGLTGTYFMYAAIEYLHSLRNAYNLAYRTKLLTELQVRAFDFEKCLACACYPHTAQRNDLLFAVTNVTTFPGYGYFLDQVRTLPLHQLQSQLLPFPSPLPSGLHILARRLEYGPRKPVKDARLL